MAQDEFAIIRQYLHDVGPVCADTRLGIGDDAAVVEVPPGKQLVVCMDTLISGVHFPTETAAADIAVKALAVNLSDLAAMAATPSWFLLSVSLPQFDADWLRHFADGLRQSAECYGVQLIGGDTCRGDLSITIQIAGLVPAGGYVSRAGASVGDLVLVSGQLGNAGLGLAHLQGSLELPEELASRCLQALNRPQPRLDLVDFLREFASAAIDISDGLQGDLGHILKASGCGARLEQTALPVDPWIVQHDLYHHALAAGDDYQICCTLAPRHRGEVENWNRQYPERSLTIIGELVESSFLLRVGDAWTDLGDRGGFRHFD
jgi:thiamine-monophosphate kinase